MNETEKQKIEEEWDKMFYPDEGLIRNTQHKQFLVATVANVLAAKIAEIKRCHETYMWDRNLDEDETICIMKNRGRMNDAVLQILEE